MAFEPHHPIVRHTIARAIQNIEWAVSVTPEEAPAIYAKDHTFLQGMSLGLAGPPVLTDTVMDWLNTHMVSQTAVRWLSDSISAAGLRILTQTAFSVSRLQGLPRMLKTENVVDSLRHPRLEVTAVVMPMT